MASSPLRTQDVTPSDSSPGRIRRASSPFSDRTASPFSNVNTPSSEATNWTDEEAMSFICNKIMGYSSVDDSKHYVQQTLEDYGYTNQVDFIALTDDKIKALKYTDEKGNSRDLIPGVYKKIMQTRNFVHYVIERESTTSNNIWRDGIYDEKTFRTWVAEDRDRANTPLKPENNTSKILSTPSTPKVDFKKSDPSSDFRKTIKKDKSNYPILEDDKTWMVFYRKFVIVANTEGLDKQLDEKYKPYSDENIALDEMENKYFYGVLDHCVRSDKGKQIIRNYGYSSPGGPNARKAWAELVKIMSTSIKANFLKAEIWEFLSTARFGENVANTTAEHFIMTYLEKFRILDDLSEPSEYLPDQTRFTLLYTALSKVEEFRSVRAAMDVHGKPNDYTLFVSMIEKAAVSYDKNRSKANGKQKVNMMKQSSGSYRDEEEEEFDAKEGDIYGGIDIDHEQLLINQTFQRKQGMNNPNQPMERLPKELWVQLDQQAQDTIRKFIGNQNFPTGNQKKLLPSKPNTPPTRKLNAHEFGQEEPEPAAPDPAPDEAFDTGQTNTLLDMVKGEEEQEQAAIAGILSAYAARQAKARNTKRVTTKQIKLNVLYRVSKHDTRSKSASLIDRGANGGLVGDDVRVLSISDRTVDVAGLDNHTVNGLPIVTAAGVVKTLDGEVIVILNQYALLGKNKTIHCCTQLEHFKNDVCDKSVKFGGQQCLKTLDGRIIPFAIRNGLTYLDIRPPTDWELKNLPHIVLTSDEEWDPNVADHEHDPNNYSKIFPNENYVHNPNFDDVGDYTKRTILVNDQTNSNKPLTKLEEL